MSTCKRIQKKRDKERLVNALCRFAYGDREETRSRCAHTERRLRKMTAPELVRLSERVLKAWALHTTPLRRMAPRVSVGRLNIPWRSEVSTR